MAHDTDVATGRGKAAPVGLSSLLYKRKDAKNHANVKGVAFYLPV